MNKQHNILYTLVEEVLDSTNSSSLLPPGKRKSKASPDWLLNFVDSCSRSF